MLVSFTDSSDVLFIEFYTTEIPGHKDLNLPSCHYFFKIKKYYSFLSPEWVFCSWRVVSRSCQWLFPPLDAQATPHTERQLPTHVYDGLDFLRPTGWSYSNTMVPWAQPLRWLAPAICSLEASYHRKHSATPLSLPCCEEAHIRPHRETVAQQLYLLLPPQLKWPPWEQRSQPEHVAPANPTWNRKAIWLRPVQAMETGEIISGWCFKPLSLRVLCYIEQLTGHHYMHFSS